MLKRIETKIILALLGCFLISVAFSAVYRYDNQKVIISGHETDYAAAEDYSYYIDSITKNDKQVRIEGWVAKLGQDIDYVNRTIVLIDTKGQLYHLNTVMVVRTSVTEYFNDGHDYDHSGICAACMLSDLQPDETYKVGVIIREKDGSTSLLITDKTVSG
ncbi:MAG: hypothetical protein ACFWUC_01020 [Oscillospiraceae bacterium]|jgi:7-cyano-7-deazaguanine synthase in queuosine biosynthesis